MVRIIWNILLDQPIPWIQKLYLANDNNNLYFIVFYVLQMSFINLYVAKHLVIKISWSPKQL